MATNSKIPKIISGIVATICLIASAFVFLTSFWFWISFEIAAAVLVAIGCFGEWWLHHRPAGPKKLEKASRHAIESKYIGMVAIGVLMELFALGHSVREGVKLENRVAELNNESEQFRAKADQLELIIKPRGLTPGQVEQGVSLLKKYAGTKADVSAMMNDWESIGFARPFNAVLAGSGWNVESDVGFVMEQGRGAEDGVFISTNEFSNIAAATALNDFLNGCGVESRLLPPIYGRFRSSQNALYIRVGTKPPPTIPAK